MTYDPVAERMKQYALDYDLPAIAPAKAGQSSRLLILACSDTKAAGEGLAAKDRYNGPLWQTLRTVDPHGDLASVMFLSARYGLCRSTKILPEYNQRLTLGSAEIMKERGLCGWYPYRAELPRTASGLENWVGGREPLTTAALEVCGALREVAGGKFTEVAVCGGKTYIDLGLSLVSELHAVDWLDDQGSVTVINDQIGYMRTQLRDWLKR